MQELKRTSDESPDKKAKIEFKYEVMLCFWFAVHREQVDMVRMIFDIDPIIDKILRVIRITGAEELIIKRGRDEDKERKKRGRKAAAAIK